MFWKIFAELCSNKGMSANAVAKELGIASGTVTAWKSGRVPHHGTLIKIADYFNVSVDYLLGKPETTEPEAPTLSPEKQKILDACENLSPEQLEKVVEYVEFITAKKRSGD